MDNRVNIGVGCNIKSSMDSERCMAKQIETDNS